MAGHDAKTPLHSNEISNRVRLGIRAHDLGRFSALESARAVSAGGFDCVQLALGKAIEGLDLSFGWIGAARVSEVAAAFSACRVGIEVLGCYINPIHPDAETREGLLSLFKEHLRHAQDFGCNFVALESGSLNADYSPHPGNADEAAWQEMLGSMQVLVAEAANCGVVVCIEAVTSHVISTPEKMRRLLDAIPSPHLKVVFDPVNLLTVENCGDQREIMRRSFELFGERIAVVHAKDFRLENGIFAICPAGTGSLDYEFLLNWLSDHKPGIAILLEEAGPRHAAACRDLIMNRLLPLTP
jgi:L-ribulose-5-phosphate 3-epimerase